MKKFFRNRQRCRDVLAVHLALVEAMSARELLHRYGGDDGIHEEFPLPPGRGEDEVDPVHVRIEASTDVVDERPIVGVFISCYTMDFNFTFPVTAYHFVDLV